MPEISRFFGIVITMYYGDPMRHPLPHFHARYGEYQASFLIDPPTWLAGVMPRRQMQMILGWAEIHKDELTANWLRLVDEELISKIDGLS